MIQLLDEEYRNNPKCKAQMLKLEFQVIKQLQFDVQMQTPSVFLGRFLILTTSHVTSKTKVQAMEHTAMQFLKFMAYKNDYITYLPSH